MKTTLKFISIVLICVNIYLLLSGEIKYAIYMSPATIIWTILLVIIIKFNCEDESDEEEYEENEKLTDDEYY